MNFVAAKCPSCNGDLQLDDTKETAFCMYCGSLIFVEKAVAMGHVSVEGVATSEKLLKNAEVFLRLGEEEKAREIYQRLSNDYPEDYRGWWGLFLLQTDQLDTLVRDFKFAEYAVSVAEEPRKQELKQEIAAYLSPGFSASPGHAFRELDKALEDELAGINQGAEEALRTSLKARRPQALLLVFGILLGAAALLSLAARYGDGYPSVLVALGFCIAYKGAAGLMAVRRRCKADWEFYEGKRRAARQKYRQSREKIASEHEEDAQFYRACMQRILSR